MQRPDTGALFSLCPHETAALRYYCSYCLVPAYSLIEMSVPLRRMIAHGPVENCINAAIRQMNKLIILNQQLSQP